MMQPSSAPRARPTALTVVAPAGAFVAKTVASTLALAVVIACSPSGSLATASTTASGSPSAEAPPSSCVLPPRAPAPAHDATESSTSIVGAPLATCSTTPLTGVYRDGRCATGPDDVGVHVVCAEVTDTFLRFSAARGNDLVTPARGFPGLKSGDRWCLCAARWAEAEAAGTAPAVVLAATDAAALRTIPREKLVAHALPLAAPSGAAR